MHTSGYVRNGAFDTTCQADGTWSNPVPTCEPGQCSTLTAPTNGALSPLGATSFGNTVTFTCNSGYLLYGATTSTCQAGGAWSNTVPTCRPVPCPPLANPSKGALSPLGPYAYPNQVTVTCNSGYDLDGVTPVTCQADGTWTNSVGTCRPRQCNALTAPTNGALSPAAPHNYPATVTFSCNAGHVVNGAETTKCQTDGSWSSPVPTCTQTPGQCSVLSAPTNGARTPPTGSNSFGNTITFICNSGHVLNGATTATCQTDGTWSSPVPTCTPRPCPALTTPTNGALSPPGTQTMFSVDDPDKRSAESPRNVHLPEPGYGHL
ncbi:E-selectin-like [Branchiostoma floridae]|uniref:E-selectin-like n=1 Tax=Branchiostoma floridae TaxID=7739 RepID=A0A9J7MIY7_BRAFL|nr:E-selectin-like [Branchiostoma floridae]